MPTTDQLLDARNAAEACARSAWNVGIDLVNPRFFTLSREDPVEVVAEWRPVFDTLQRVDEQWMRCVTPDVLNVISQARLGLDPEVWFAGCCFPTAHEAARHGVTRYLNLLIVTTLGECESDGATCRELLEFIRETGPTIDLPMEIECLIQEEWRRAVQLSSANKREHKKLFPNGLDGISRDIIDLATMLETEADKGKSISQIAQEFSSSKGKTLLASIRRLKRKGRVVLPGREHYAKTAQVN